MKLLKKAWYKIMQKRTHRKLIDAVGFEDTWYWATQWNNYCHKLSRL